MKTGKNLNSLIKIKLVEIKFESKIKLHLLILSHTFKSNFDIFTIINIRDMVDQSSFSISTVSTQLTRWLLI